MVDAILQLKAPYDADPENTLRLLAEYALAEFGKGGNPSASQIEDYIGWVNTPPQQGYVRLRADEIYGIAMEVIHNEHGGCVMADLIRVEWPELMPEGGWPPISWEVPIIGLDGQPTGATYMQTLGVIAS